MNLKSKHLFDCGTIRKFNDEFFKVTHFNMVNRDYENRIYTAKGEAGNEEKLKNNIVRSRTRILELALCNAWNFFITFTLNKEKYNRYDLQKYIKDLSQYIRDYRKKFGVSVKYLLIPEQHSDGAWHIHGFIMGLPEDHLTAFTLEDKLPYKIRKKLENGESVFNWPPYANKFGHCTFEPIRNHEAISKYITKYITKELALSIKELNAHMYYASRGLNSSQVLLKSLMSKEIPDPDYVNDYVTTKVYKTFDEAIKCFA